ncbi:MauE/DoxX family redox-associated membrane protein [Actinoallomurus sp. CA-142502]|uniref:MauE/DoxX family redox-associated membrane protein n=1 Tax=Actinoallomurus sp. CA-142502 TaxID=3239885 RepID=UPI003D92D3F4
MAEMLTGVCAGTVALVLLLAFAGHLRAPRTLPAALAAHRVLPGPLRWPVAVAVIALEGALGAATGYAVAAGRTHALTLAAGGAAVLFAGYAGYGWYVLRTRPSVPCGCATGPGGDTPMSGWVAGRAAALALASLVAVTGTTPAHGTHTAIAVLASVVFAVLLSLLPQAMFDPERQAAP